MNDTTYVGMRYVPVFAEPSQWDISRQYENLMMVTNEGETYISKEFVPTGAELTNEDYWVKISVPSGGGSGGGINYSTEEQDTGTLWVDGKHIYQKTIVLDSEINITSSGATIPSTNFNGLNIDNVVKATAYRLISDNRDGCANIPISMWIYEGVYNVYAIGTWNGVRTITIQYTKTTDSGVNILELEPSHSTPVA